MEKIFDCKLVGGNSLFGMGTPVLNIIFKLDRVLDVLWAHSLLMHLIYLCL